MNITVNEQYLFLCEQLFHLNEYVCSLVTPRIFVPNNVQTSFILWRILCEYISGDQNVIEYTEDCLLDKEKLYKCRLQLVKAMSKMEKGHPLNEETILKIKNLKEQKNFSINI